jgi:hypothetical protein
MIAAASTAPTASPSTGHARNALKMGFRKKIATLSPTVRYVRDMYDKLKAIDPTTPRIAHRCHNDRSPKNVSRDKGTFASYEGEALCL